MGLRKGPSDQSLINAIKLADPENSLLRVCILDVSPQVGISIPGSRFPESWDPGPFYQSRILGLAML